MFRPCGYVAAYGYIGFLPDGTKRMYATEKEYMEQFEESEKDSDDLVKAARNAMNH